MKQPTAPIYPELPSEDGQNYRLHKISDRKTTHQGERFKEGLIHKV